MVDELVANPQFLVLGGERREMTVYFSDIAGFTGLSERLDPPTLVAFLQTYLEEMTDRLLEEGATLDKYEGDAIVAFFGAPVAVPDHAARCLRAALAHLRALPVLNERLKRARLLPEGAELKVRIGISTGQMVVGNFGSTRRFDYTVMGDAVNVGARLEGANRFFGTTVLLAGATRDQALRSFSAGATAAPYAAVPGAADRQHPPVRGGGTPGGAEFLLRRIGPVRLAGKAEAVEVYELLDDAAANARAGLDLYEAALADFERGQIESARAKFQEVLKLRPADGPTLAYLARVDSLLRDGITSPPGPWDMTSK
jgi:adenylate cyclase